MTILHVEDQKELAQLVRTAFASFGFRGDILQASLVAEAIALLDERRRIKAPLDLILLDMKLPDGSGMDVLRKVKASSTWRMTPVIVLSGESDPGLINEAYALGANCYLPKHGRARGTLGSVQALYQCWIEGALLPHPSFPPLIQTALARGVHLRARMAHFYLGLARGCSSDPEQEKFWLERSLIEGNKSNLIAFFQGQLSDRDAPPEVAEHAIEVQQKIERTLREAEVLQEQQPSPAPAKICRWVLDLAESWDEDGLAETYGMLFLKNPAVTQALKVQSAGQLRELAGHVLDRSEEPELRRRAESLLALAGRLASWDGSKFGTEAG